MPARTICELNAPARPRSPVTSRMPTVPSDSCSLRIGRFGTVPAASAARRVIRPVRPPLRRTAPLRRLARHPADRARVGPQRLDALLGPAQARGGDHLHRARDLLDVLDRRDPALDVLERHGLRLTGGDRAGLPLVGVVALLVAALGLVLVGLARAAPALVLLDAALLGQ